MAPFKDTRFRTMAPSPTPGGAAAPMPPVPPSAAAEQVRKVDFGSIVPAQMDLARPAASHAAGAQDLSGPPHVVEAFAALPAHPLSPGYSDPAHAWPPPVGAEDSFTHHPPAALAPLAGSGPTGTIEDTTAELLRPMLRQWLADNMPRMVEKALHIEVAESVKTGKKLTGQ